MVGKDKETSPRKGRSATGKAPKERKSSASRVDKSPARAAAKTAKAAKAAKSDSHASPRKKSPVRQPATPPRARGRPRSPGRPKSPTRVEKETVRKRPQIIKVDDSDSESDTPTTSSIQTRSRRTASKEPSMEIVNLRSRVRRDNADIYNLRSSYEPVKKLHEFSDEDDVHSAPAHRTSKRLHIGAVLITLVYCLGELALTYLIPLLCNERQCVFRVPGRADLDKVLGSFNLPIFLSFTSFVLFNGIVSIVPLGGRKYASLVARDSRFEYVLNALAALAVQIAILITLEVYHIPVTLHIINNYLALVTSAVVLSALLGAILFIKGCYARKEDLHSSEQGALNDFIMGAELNPRFGPMDVKFVVVRVCIIGTILLCLCYVYQSLEMIATPPQDAKSAVSAVHLLQSVRIRPTLFVMCTLMTIYFADQFFFESGLLSTMEFRSVPWGFLKCNEYLAGLFVYSAAPKYVFDYGVELDSWELALCTMLFLAGYVLYRGANSQKHAFRENPYGLSVARFESIPTTTGRKILCSGYWGFVRHPNYLGDILLNAALVRFVWPTPLLLLFVFIIGHLVLRAYVDNKQCRQRYGVAWERYCQRVPRMLIPKVF